MTTRDVRESLAAVEAGGHLSRAAYADAVALALRGPLTDGERGVLLAPAAAIAESAALRRAGLSPESLSAHPDVAELMTEIARAHGGEPDRSGLAWSPGPPPPPEPAMPDTPPLDAGTDLGDPTSWALSTPGADVRFSTAVFGRTYPALVMEKPAVADPGRRDLVASHRGALLAADSLEALGAAVRAVVAEEAAWFDAEDLANEAANRRFRAQNRRRSDFLVGVRDLAVHRPALGLPVNRLLIELRDDIVSGRRYAMQVGEHTNYWPYDNGYSEVLEKLAAQAPPDSDEAAVILNRLFDIWRRKSVFKGRAGVDEKDAERTLGGPLVWRPPFGDRFGHRVSLAADSTPYEPGYEALTWPASDDRPAARVYTDADGTVRFDHDPAAPDRTGQPVPDAALEALTRQPVPADQVTLRPPEPGEVLRADLPFDWQDNGSVSVTRIDIGWWGHCHNEAPANAMGMDPKRPVTLYRAHPDLPRDRRRADFTEEDCWDLVGAFTADHEGDRVRDPATGRVSAPGYVLYSSGGAYRPTRVDETAFVGNRNNGGHWFEVTPEGSRRVRIDAEVVEIWGLEDPTHRYDEPMNRFRRDVENDDGTFDPNPDWVESGMSDDDMIAVQAGGRRLTLKTRFITFDGQGRRVERTLRVELDPSRDAFVKLADEIEGMHPGGGGRVVEHWYNPATRSLRAVRLDLRAEAGFERAEQSSEDHATVEVTAAQETTYDSVTAIDEFVVADMGLPFTFDTSSGQAVWNYPVSHISRDVEQRVTRDEDGESFTYTTYALAYQTMGGPSATTRYIIKRDALGRTVRALALEPMPDFAYRNERWVCAPLAPDVQGRAALNLRGITTGYLTDATGRRIVTALWERQAVVLYASLCDGVAPDHAWLVEGADGRLRSFADEASWSAAVAAIEASG